MLQDVSGEVPFGAYLTQLFVAHISFTAVSSVLMAMAVDCYVAICQPPHYGALLAQCTVGIVAIAIVTHGACVMVPLVVLLQRLPYCGQRALPHTYCEHMGAALLACGDMHPNTWQGLATMLLSPSLDLGLIGASYDLILRADFVAAIPWCPPEDPGYLWGPCKGHHSRLQTCPLLLPG